MASEGADSIGGCAMLSPTCVMTADGFSAETAACAFSIWRAMGAGSGNDTGTGKTNRQRLGRSAGEKRKGTGPTRGK